jgi:large subunit ribosomal protein L18
MINKESKNVSRVRRHARVRAKISGTPECPRLSVFRSNKNISAQIIDDVNGVTLVAVSSVSLKLANGGNIEAASKVGEAIAKAALAKNIKAVVFDRSGYVYHGRVQAVAEAAREAGLEF